MIPSESSSGSIATMAKDKPDHQKYDMIIIPARKPVQAVYFHFWNGKRMEFNAGKHSAHLNIAAGTAVRFEPKKEMKLVVYW